ncbi:MAG: GntR family transcriptional regulator [Oscillospiraceae bacterium]|nr:GntR family transcriptional regulator [Oscillospiraceae bacterium]
MEQIILLVSSGFLKKDDQLPSLRQLSAQLSLNINTVKRALSELEDRGITYSVAGKGIFISGDTPIKNIYLDRALEDLKMNVANAKAHGAAKKRILEIINDIYKGDE